ncbi:MAG: polysaccharide biosynthesis protein, partial [Spirochaetota bacterium]
MNQKRIIIIGAGFAGQALAAEIREKGILGRVVAFIDDDPEKIGTRIHAIPVFGPIITIESILKKTAAEEAIIAVPGASRELLKNIYSLLKAVGFDKIRILPTLSQIIDGEAHLIQTRAFDAQDLLGRSPIIIPLKESLKYLRGRRVLITGAGGSIGSELSRQLLSGGAERLYLLGHGENSLYEIERELRLLQEEGVGEKAVLVPVIGELQDREYVNFILKRLKADVIFHCAAHKHVPMVEANPVEAIKNNVFGTKNLVEAAVVTNTSRFVLISTDKSAEPVSIYGASKLLAEEIVLSQASEHMASMVVRFGNVLGSRGSIVPLFRKQILKGGPVTVTHPAITRYFMTIPEAASLVLKAGGVGSNGALYLLDMGEPIPIKEL